MTIIILLLFILLSNNFAHSIPNSPKTLSNPLYVSCSSPSTSSICTSSSPCSTISAALSVISSYGIEDDSIDEGYTTTHVIHVRGRCTGPLNTNLHHVGECVTLTFYE